MLIRSETSQVENQYYASYNIRPDRGNKEESLAKFFYRIYVLVSIEILSLFQKLRQ